MNFFKAKLVRWFPLRIRTKLEITKKQTRQHGQSWMRVQCFMEDFHFTPIPLTIATVIDRESLRLIKRQILSRQRVPFRGKIYLVAEKHVPSPFIPYLVYTEYHARGNVADIKKAAWLFPPSVTYRLFRFCTRLLIDRANKQTHGRAWYAQLNVSRNFHGSTFVARISALFYKTQHAPDSKLYQSQNRSLP